MYFHQTSINACDLYEIIRIIEDCSKKKKNKMHIISLISVFRFEKIPMIFDEKFKLGPEGLITFAKIFLLDIRWRKEPKLNVLCLYVFNNIGFSVAIFIRFYEVMLLGAF